jgi:hypothetical protein
MRRRFRTDNAIVRTVVVTAATGMTALAPPGGWNTGS